MVMQEEGLEGGLPPDIKKGDAMSVLRAVVSDRDGIIHELVLKKRKQSEGYSWYYGNIALIVTPAATPDEALSFLKREIAPSRTDIAQIISIVRSSDDRA